jgi:O-antigen ligase
VAVSGQKTLAPGAATLGARLEGDPRPRIWGYAVQRAAERPWLGYGYGRGILRKDFDAHFGDELYWHSHNMFLNCALGGGVLLLGAFVAMLGALAHALWRGSRDWTDGARAAYALALAVLAAAIVKSLTDDILIRETSLLLWSLLGMGFGRASAASGRSAQDV